MKILIIAFLLSLALAFFSVQNGATLSAVKLIRNFCAYQFLS